MEGCVGRGRRLDLGWRAHSAGWTDAVRHIDLSTQKLYDFINHCHPNRFSNFYL